MEDRKKLIGATSALFDLKAELFRKQEALKQQKAQQTAGLSDFKPVKHKSEKRDFWKGQNAGVQERSKKDVVEISEESNDLAESKLMLEKKAKLYEKLSGGNVVLDDEDNQRYMVNFQKKSIDKILEEKHSKNVPGEKNDSIETVSKVIYDEFDKQFQNTDEEWVDYVDSFGRSRRCLKKDLSDLKDMDLKVNKVEGKVVAESSSADGPELVSEDMKREQLRQQWEEQEAKNAEKGAVHYEDIRYNEVRDHGVGYFTFSVDDEQRNQQLELLKSLRDQTEKSRGAAERLKAKRKAMMKARLAKVRARKGIPEPEESSPKLEEEDEENKDDNDAENSNKLEEAKQNSESQNEVPTKVPKIRPWDIGKDMSVTFDRTRTQLFSQKDWVEKQREERPVAFAPPSFYYSATKSKKYNPVNKSTAQPSSSTVEDAISAKLAYFKENT